jgi:hypothetical protein
MGSLSRKCNVRYVTATKSGILYFSASLGLIPIHIASSFGSPSDSPPIGLPPAFDLLHDIQLPNGSTKNDLPLGDCKPVFKCPKGNDNQLGGCTVNFDCK